MALGASTFSDFGGVVSDLFSASAISDREAQLKKRD
jgi:hypothetical protein